MHVLHGVVCCVLLYVWNVNYVYVHIVEEKALGVCHVWKLIRGAYRIRKKEKSKDR